jgi:rRNA maturation endonuclease Nob1
MFHYGEDPDRIHSHQCKKCGTIWSHQGWNRGNEEAHRCPRCGQRNVEPMCMPKQEEPVNPYAT